MLHIPPQQVGHLIVVTSFDVARNLICQMGRRKLHLGEKTGSGLVETVDVELECCDGVCDGLLDGHTARVDELSLRTKEARLHTCPVRLRRMLWNHDQSVVLLPISSHIQAPSRLLHFPIPIKRCLCHAIHPQYEAVGIFRHESGSTLR